MPNDPLPRIQQLGTITSLADRVLIVDRSTPLDALRAAIDAERLLCASSLERDIIDLIHRETGCPAAPLADYADVQFYGLQKTSDGWRRFVEYADGADQAAAPDAAGAAAPAPQTGAASAQSTFARWISTAAQPRPPRKLLADASPVDLYKSAKNFTDEIIKSFSVLMDNAPATVTLQASIYAVACNVTGSESADYYCVQAQCVFTPEVGAGGFGMIQYIVQMTPQGFPDDDGHTLIASSPDTTVGQVTTSSSTSTTLSGNIGFFGDSGQGSITGSVSFGDAQSFSTPGVTIENDSSGPGQPASWSFMIDPSSEVRLHAFQPFVQALWRVAATPSATGTTDDVGLRVGITLSGRYLTNARLWFTNGSDSAIATVAIPLHTTSIGRPPRYKARS